jgi:frataxin
MAPASILSSVRTASIRRMATRGLATRSGAASASPKALRPTLAAASTIPSAVSRQARPSPVAARSSFSTSSLLATPLSSEVLETAKPAPLTEEQYHELADEFLDALLTKYEALQDDRPDVDVDYSAGVMNISIADLGTYVVNKQPPNKQLWLSSPKSGPKRYDYVILSEGQDHKQDTARGGWVYLRDGTTLNEVLLNETGVDMDLEPVGSL